MTSSTRRIVTGLVPVLVIALEAVGQAAQAPATAPAAAPRRSIERINGDVYTATNNNHRTVFLVTKEGIVLAAPINAAIALNALSDNSIAHAEATQDVQIDQST